MQPKTKAMAEGMKDIQTISAQYADTLRRIVTDRLPKNGTSPGSVQSPQNPGAKLERLRAMSSPKS